MSRRENDWSRETESLAKEPLAIVGIGCRFPGGANSPEGFWRLLMDGTDAVSEIPDGRFDADAVFDPDPSAPGKLYTTSGGFVADIDGFDAAFFGISPREARRIDPQHRLFLETVWEGLEDAGLVPADLAGTACGVFVGISSHDYSHIQARPENHPFIDTHSNSGGASCIAANRVSYLLDLRGPSMAVDTACSSSLTVLHLACQSIWSRESSMAIVGGVNALLAPEPTIGFSKASMLAADGRCKAFDARADGYVRSEGAGAVVLKRLRNALEDGDRIYALVRASVINQDGRTSGMSQPSADAQAQMLRDAVRQAAVDHLDFDYVEAHGTGTKVGDPAEAEAIGTVLGRGRPPDAPLAIGSVKTNIGHLEAAAGIAGLIKAALVLRHREIPPSLHLREPNPAIPWEELRLRVVTAVEPLRSGSRPALAAVNAFGFGGANATVVVEEWQSELADLSDHQGPRAQVLTLSAKTREALRDQARLYRDFLPSNEHHDLEEVCRAAALRRSRYEHRAAVVGDSREAMAEAIGAFADGDESASVAVGHAVKARQPRIAFVFPGMGAQWHTMGRELLASEPVFRTTVEECDALLAPLSGSSLLKQLTADEDASNVGLPFFDQVANLAIQVGLAALLRSWGVAPGGVVGHSSGEMAAAYLAGALDLSSAIRLAFHRGRLQHRAIGTGKMLAVGVALETAQKLLAGVETEVSVAAVNSPVSVTLSGSAEALDRICRELNEQQVFARFLSVTVPYHSPQMDSLRDEFLDAIGDIEPREAQIELISEVTGEPVGGYALDAKYWWRNLREPVLFGAAIDQLIGAGYDTFVEIGPHPVLAVSIRECLAHRGVDGLVLPTLRRGDGERARILRSLAELHVRGHPVDWSSLYPRGSFVSLPKYPWQRERLWIESATADDPPASAAGTHTGRPLLGRRLRAPDPCWELDLSDSELSYLGDHVVGQGVVFPGAGYVETALSAAAELMHDVRLALEGIEFHKLLSLDWPPERGVGVLQARFKPDDRRLEVHAHRRHDGNDDWALHASARLGNAEDDVPPLDLSSIRRRCTTVVSTNDLQQSLDHAGYHFGPMFRRMVDVRLGEGEALARLQLPQAVSGDGYCVHPLVLDASFQLVAVATGLIGPGAARPAVPVSVRRVDYWRRPPISVWAYASARPDGGGRVCGDSFLLDEDGQVLLACEQLELRPLEEGSFGRSEDVDDWLYQVHWEEHPLPEPVAGKAGRRVAPEAFPAPVAPNLDALVESSRRARYYDVVEPRLDALAGAWARQALGALGPAFEGTEGAAEHRKLLHRLIDIAGLGAEPGTTPDALTGRLIQEHPEYRREAELLRLCGTQLSGVLTGEVDARQLIFGDALDALSAFYHDSPSTSFYNAIIADCVEAVIEDSPPHFLHALEVGGGTGATSAALTPFVGRQIARYVFTDISPFFLQRARERFSEQAGMEFATLDIEREPRAQGFDHPLDLVIAAHVVHATADLRKALDNVRALLAPNGILVLAEPTRRSPWLDLIFGVFEGWWRFTDFDLRPSHPTLPAEKWEEILRQCGFDSVATVADSPRHGEAQVSVIVARKRPDATALAEPRWVVLADRLGFGERVGAELSRQGATVGFVYAETDGVQAQPKARRVSLTDTDELRRALDELTSSGRRIDGIIHAWSLDAPSGEDVSTGEVMRWQQALCGSALTLATFIGPTVQVVFLTAGAQTVPGDEHCPNVVQSPLWGLVRVMMTEHAQAACRIIDIAPHAGQDDVDAVVREMGHPHGDQEVAIRGVKRLVQEVHRGTRDGQQDRPTRLRSRPSGSFGIAVRSPGVLDSLDLVAMPDRRPGLDEVCIRVAASGLNFRSVLLALEMLPSVAAGRHEVSGALGMEHAGHVIATGELVEGFRVGDEVVALAAGGMESQVVAKASLTAHKPASLSWAEAASVPSAFLTAEYALGHLARLQPGERVLIHSAAGGVGLAAVQFAQRRGGEVLATAGTAEKRDFLRSLGVEHVMDSRSLDWARDVRELAGGEGMDVILNSLSGEAIRKGLDVLRRHGRFVEIGVRDILRDAAVGLLPFRRNLSFFALDLIEVGTDRPAVIGTLLRDVLDRIASGETRALPLTTFDLAEAEQAFRLMAQGRHIGKIVLTLDKPEYRVRANPEAPLFRADGSYLITGGLGGFGVKVAEWMARSGAGTVVLMSRSGVAKDGVRGLHGLSASGADVVVIRGDVSREEDVERVLIHVREHCPPLRGVFHAAMVLDDDLVARLDAARLARVLAPKVAGAWNLHRLTSETELDYFVLFSSLTSLWGHQAQGSYAAANAFLDALATYRRSIGRPCSSVNWGPIGEVGYVARHPDVAHYLSWAGQEALSPDQAVKTLETVLRRATTNVMAARVDWSRWAQQLSGSSAARPFVRFARRYGRGREPTGQDGDLMAALRAAPDAERPLLVERRIMQRVAKISGAAAEGIDRDRSLTEMGFDSLMMVELETALKRDFAMPVSIVELLQGLSVRALVSRACERLSSDSAGSLPSAPAADPVPPTSERWDLSFEQRRFWFLDRLHPGTPACNLYVAYRIVGELNVEALRWAVAELVRRHDLLRANFATVEGEPVQVIAATSPPVFKMVDLADRLGTTEESGVARILTEEVRQPFDLAVGPLFRATLIRIGNREHIFCVTVHHIIFDAQSANVLMAEGLTLYRSRSLGRGFELPEISASYRDYVQWQRTLLGDSAGQAAHLAYWRMQLSGVQPLELPRTRPMPARRTLDGAHVHFVIDRETTARLVELSRAEGATLFTTLVATFQVLLRAYSGQDDVTIGTPVVTRGAPGSEATIGCFINTLALRTDLSGGPTFTEVLRKVRRVAGEAFAHQDVPFDRVVEEVSPARDIKSTPLFQAVLVVHTAETPDLRLPGLRLEPVEVESATAIFDLLLLVEVGEELRCSLEYSSDLFDRDMAEQITGGLRALVHRILDRPDTPISQLSVLSEAEQRLIVSEWNETDVRLADLRVDELFERQAAATPDAPAVTSGSAQLSYAELNARSDALAQRLVNLGVGTEAIVAVWMAPSPNLLATALGIMKTGGTILPLDTRNPPTRLLSILADAEPRVVIADRRWVRELAAQGVEVLEAGDALNGVAQDGKQQIAVDIARDAIAYVIYTSGSTGIPNGVLVTHRGLSNQVQARQHRFPLSKHDRVLQSIPLGFDPSMWELFGPLCFGATVVIPAAASNPGDVRALGRVLAEERITVMQIVPSVLRELLTVGVLGECGSLRHVFCGGETLTPGLVSEFFAQSHAQLHNVYGPAEASIDTTYWTCDPESETDPVPIGFPLPNVRVYILDGGGQPVPLGVAGELHIAGPGVANGYLNRPSLTSEKFVPNRFDPTGPLYRTGDLARHRRDGAIEFLGRNDNQVKVRGARVALEEVEVAIAAVPGVRHVACVAEQDQAADRAIVAFVVFDPEGPQDVTAFRQRLVHFLPAQMVPSRIVAVASLPLNANGKADRQALAEVARTPSALPGRVVLPRDLVERQLAEIWEHCLGRGPIDVSADFFELGGHSLLAAQVVSLVQERFGRELSLAAFLEGPTIEKVARVVGRRAELQAKSDARQH